MDELLWKLIVGILQLVVWVIRGVFRLLGSGVNKLEQLGAEELDRRRGAATPEARPAAQAAPSLAPPRASAPVWDAVRARAKELASTGSALGRLAEERAQTARFLPVLNALVTRARALKSDPAWAADGALAREEALAQLLEIVIVERRGELAELLGDTDALSNAAYAPIVEYCRNQGIALASDRAVTLLDGDKLFYYSVSEPTGLAAIVLPADFATEITTWPAIAHEIAHDFFHSVTALPQQLRRATGLGEDARLPQLVGDLHRELARIPHRATAAWMEELFADAFGTMMMGPAYVETMRRSFAAPEEPARVVTIAAESIGGRACYEAHPPAHVRVVVATRLLARMGYGREAEELCAGWCRDHEDPQELYVPLPDGRWLSVPAGPLLDRAATIGETLYLTGLPCLREQPLRSIPGLDFGPREHEEARRVAARFAAGRSARPGDPRLLVAGAVLATLAAPAQAARIYALARQAVIGVDAASAGPTPAATSADEAEGPLGAIDSAALREAMLLRTILAPPSSRRGLGRG